jgi:hypothetical protein
MVIRLKQGKFDLIQLHHHHLLLSNYQLQNRHRLLQLKPVLIQ